MKLPLFIILIVLFLGSAENSKCIAQTNIKDSTINVSMMALNFGYQTPQMDLAKNFLNNLTVGAGYQYKFKSNWILTGEANFFWRDTIKNNSIVDEYLTSGNMVINGDGLLVHALLFERGFNGYVGFGRIFPWFGPNNNSGIMLTAKVGALQHKVLIRTLGENVHSLSDERKKGYDRLTTGASAGGFLGYLYLGNRKASFLVGVDYLYARTVNRRGFNYDEMAYDTEKRNDVLFGFRISYVYPFYRRVSKEYYTD